MSYKHRTKSGKLKHYQSRGHYEDSLRGMFANQNKPHSKRKSNLVLASKIKSKKLLHKQMSNVSGKQSLSNRFEKNIQLSNKKILGEGNWSVVYDYDENTVLKVNKEQPDHYTRMVGEKVTVKPFTATFKEMLNETNAYDILKKENYTLLPKIWKDKAINDKYYSKREKGIFNLEDTKDRFDFRNWIKGSVRQSDFDKFNEEIFDVALKHGYFNDNLQPALRKDGSLFLVDFGQFVRLSDKVDDLGNVIGKQDASEIDKNKWDAVDITKHNVKFLADKMHLQFNIPKNLANYRLQNIDEQVDRWTHRGEISEENQRRLEEKKNIIRNQAITSDQLRKIDKDILQILLNPRVGQE